MSVQWEVGGPAKSLSLDGETVANLPRHLNDSLEPRNRVHIRMRLSSLQHAIGDLVPLRWHWSCASGSHRPFTRY